jgi:hypothetical protein
MLGAGIRKRIGVPFPLVSYNRGRFHWQIIPAEMRLILGSVV